MDGEMDMKWRVDPKCNCDIQTEDGKYEVASTHPNLLSGGETEPGMAQEHARLIAAAPELLEALIETRALVSEAAQVGFDYRDGNWVELLFANQDLLSRTIARATRPRREPDRTAGSCGGGVVKVVAEFSPTKWVVEKLNELKQWDHAGDYETLEKATARAKDLAQFYGKRSRVLEMPK